MRSGAFVRSYLRADPFMRRAEELAATPNKGLPVSVCGPLLDFLDGEDWQHFNQLPQVKQLAPLAKAMGLPKGLVPSAAPQQSVGAIRALAGLMEAIGPSASTCCRGRPEISHFEAVDDPLDCCASGAGRIDSAAPGTFVRIVGQGFDPTAANNVVRFGEHRASVTKASATDLVVMVPFLGLGFDGEKAKHKGGRIKVMVTTGGGDADDDFEVLKAAHGDAATIQPWCEGVGRALGKLHLRLSVNRPSVERALATDDSGAALALFRELPAATSGLARQLKALPALAKAAGAKTAQIERLIAGLLISSRALEDLRTMEAALDDPASDLLEGSGLVETICKIHEWSVKIIAVLVAILLVILIILIALVVLAIATIETVVSEAVLVPLIIIVFTVFIYGVAVIYYAMIVEVVVTIIYIVAKALQYVGEFLSWAFGEETPASAD